MKAKLLVALLLSFYPLLVNADILVLNNGQVINGTVLKREVDGGIVFKRDYATYTYPKGSFKDVQIDTNPKVEADGMGKNQIPTWSEVITKLAKANWATELKQIPATVVDNGVLKYVPYKSFRCGYNYEVNVYGDPDNPAGVEIGITGFLLKNESAKSNCLDFMKSLFVIGGGTEVLASLNWTKDVRQKDGLTFEITPPTAPDAYGGWWISIYNETALNAARASQAEIREITEARVPNTAPKSGALSSDRTWSSDEISLARPPNTKSTSSGGGPVYVRGYTRKDGTYVRAHTRSR